MARPQKYDLGYFPLDVNFFDDHKMIQIEEKAGIHGGYIALRLLAMIYADKGYYLEWPEHFELTVAKRVGNHFTGKQIREILEECLKCGLFDRRLLNENGVRTSRGVQRRWLRVQQDLRRKVDPELLPFWLVSSEETAVNDAETQQSSEESTQKEMKRNESKGNEKKVEQLAPAAPTAQPVDQPPRKKFIPPSQDAIREYFLSTVGNSQKPGCWPADFCANEAGKMFDHYKANGWKQGRGKPIVDWKASARLWIRNVKEGTFAPAVRSNVQPAPSPPASIPKATLSKAQRELNYFFDRYREDSNSVTIVSLDTMHYDTLTAAGLIKFSQEQTEEIKQTAITHLQKAGTPDDEKLLTKTMKKFGVMKFLQDYSSHNHKTVFCEN